MQRSGSTQKARLDEFVRSLPEGLDTSIGERGIRISGGQRQRIGIARALFEDPEVLVLDEATSALDNDTEAAIMESINSLHGHKTLIIIAHRLQTIEKCDIVYRVEHGEIERGTLMRTAHFGTHQRARKGGDMGKPGRQANLSCFGSLPCSWL